MAVGGETLYNGITLPDQWPPDVWTLTLDPVPYLDHPPAVISIDVGRQLFVDDFLIDSTTCTRNFHKAASPVMVPDRSWELPAPGQRGAATAMLFSDGVWYDPTDGLYKMWYFAGWGRFTRYAHSEDRLRWEKPELDMVPGTNIVMDHTQTDIELDHTNGRDSATVWLDHNAATPGERFKMMCRDQGSGDQEIFFSADGIHWCDRVVATGAAQDRSTLFYNPFRGVWGFSIRSTFQYDPQRRAWHYGLISPTGADGPGPWIPIRIRRYAEGEELVAAASSWPRLGKPKWWKFERGREMSMAPTVWLGADRLDPPRPGRGVDPQLYNLDAVAYESLMVGMMAILRDNKPPKLSGRDKINDLCLGFSRDGFHWDRPSRAPILNVSDDVSTWNAANVQSVGGCFLVVGDELHFYASGRSVSTETKRGPCNTGLATMRRDGFASMDAEDEASLLTTRPVRFRGKHLFVNLDAPQGKLLFEVLDRDGNVIAPFTRENCQPLTGDGTRLTVRWKSKGTKESDLTALAGTPVRFRFTLENGSLYAFWVSSDRSGASHGYVAAGGPGFTGAADTVGGGGVDVPRINERWQLATLRLPSDCGKKVAFSL